MYFVDIKENKFVYVWNISKHIIFLIFWAANKQSRGEEGPSKRQIQELKISIDPKIPNRLTILIYVF